MASEAAKIQSTQVCRAIALLFYSTWPTMNPIVFADFKLAHELGERGSHTVPHGRDREEHGRFCATRQHKQLLTIIYKLIPYKLLNCSASQFLLSRQLSRLSESGVR